MAGNEKELAVVTDEEQQIERWYLRLDRYPIALPDPVRYMAARMAVAYGLDPFLGEMVFIPKYKDRKLAGYEPYVGIGGLRRAARRTGEYGGREMRPCTDEERKALQVDKDAHAWFCQVWRKGIAKPFDGFGIFPMHDKDRSKAPPWRMARKRAEHAALRAAFDLELQLMEGNGLVVEVKPIEAGVTELPEQPQDLPEAPTKEEGQDPTPDAQVPPQPAQDLPEAASGEDEQQGEEPKGQEAVAGALEAVEGHLKRMEEEISPEQARAILEARTKGEVASTGLLAPVESPIDEPSQAAIEEAMQPKEPPEGESPEGPEVVTKRGNIYERLLEDANHNLEKRGYVGRYTGVEEVRQAMDEGGVKGRLLLNEYPNYLTIVLEIKERAG